MPELPVVTDQVLSVADLADRYYEFTLREHPESAYFSGPDLSRHDGLTDNSLTAQVRCQRFQDDLLERLQSLDATSLQGTAGWITHAYLMQALTSSVGRRVCRNELWNVSQMRGWHLRYGRLAGLQPVGTPILREQSLMRWVGFAGFVDTELASLCTGAQRPRRWFAR